MKADSSPPISSMLKKSGRSMTAKRPAQEPLLGKGPWFRLDGVWYTKDETGEWVKMKD